MLSKQMIRDNAPDYIGTTRINHEDCPAGTDTRRRLYLTRKHADTGVVLAHCFNCGESGAAAEKDKMIFASGSNLRENTLTEDELPDTCDPIETDKDAMAWVARYGIRPVEWDAAGITFDNDTGRVCLPIIRNITFKAGNTWERGGLLGYQLRSVKHREKGPKYLTVKFSGTEALETTILNEAAAFPVTVVVEDMLSALKVSRMVRRCIPLYGTHIRSERILELSKEYPVIVWLDNDNQTVVKAAERIVSLVHAFGRQATRVDGVDPKHYSVGDICQVLDAAMERVK
jgi:hypothetical protein